MLFLSQYYHLDREIISVLSVLGGLVLAHNVLRHNRHVGIAGNNNISIIDVDVKLEEPDMGDVKDRGSD